MHFMIMNLFIFSCKEVPTKPSQWIFITMYLLILKIKKKECTEKNLLHHFNLLFFFFCYFKMLFHEMQYTYKERKKDTEREREKQRKRVANLTD